MIAINKAQLTNGLKKIGKVIKENKKDSKKIYNKIMEVFPEASEVDVYSVLNNEITFKINRKYVGKMNLKKELEDVGYKQLCCIQNLYVTIGVINEDICITSDISIKYLDNEDNICYGSLIVKKLNL
ncbi:hypothetical protein [Fusobacterium sp.]|uniref:hypothetical protein n=1 Tax=Fusobacterium sp. TaxID=68766 RepID=UPI00260A36A1|nr:hypothetical protein [Fusobacterium sp.]